MHCRGSLAFIWANKLAGTSVRWHITHVAGRIAPGLVHDTCLPLRKGPTPSPPFLRSSRVPPPAPHARDVEVSISGRRNRIRPASATHCTALGMRSSVRRVCWNFPGSPPRPGSHPCRICDHHPAAKVGANGPCHRKSAVQLLCSPSKMGATSSMKRAISSLTWV